MPTKNSTSHNSVNTKKFKGKATKEGKANRKLKDAQQDWNKSNIVRSNGSRPAISQEVLQ